MKDYVDILFYRIILLFIDYLNPDDKLINSNYFISCNLLNIFKFLCKEHNIYFQKYFIRNLSYDYIMENPMFFTIKKENNETERLKEKSDSEKYNSSIENNKSIKKVRLNNINFYDFFLYILTKIILISNWENNYKNDINHQNPFLFDLFSSIIDLLTEIIQGCEPDLLSNLCITLENKVLDIIEDGGDLNKYKKIDSFEVFIKSIKSILFNEKHNSKFINELKSNIIHFITSILEEKNSNEIMKKYIKKYLNTNNIFKIISIILKTYYLNEEKAKLNNIEKIEKKFTNSEIMNNKDLNLNIINKAKKHAKRYRSIYKIKFRPNMNKVNKRFQFQNSINTDTSSNLKLINNPNFLLKNINHNSFIPVNNNKSQNNLFKKILTNDNNGFKKSATQITESNKRESKIFELKLTNLIFGKKIYNYFKNKINRNSDFLETLEFQLSNSFYRYIKIIKFHKKQSKNKLIDEEIQKYIEFERSGFFEKQNNNFNETNYENDLVEKYYIEKLFEEITRTVEIRTNDGINRLIIYTKLPIMKFLSKETKIEFNENVNRDNETTKKYDLMRYVEYFIKEIRYFKKYQNRWNVLFFKIDYYYLDVLSYFFALFYNIILLITLKGDNKISNIELFKQRRKSKTKISQLISNSILKWNLLYKINIYFNLILNGLLIVVWIVYKLPFYYEIDKIKYKESLKSTKNKKLYLNDKIYILLKMSIFGRNYITMLLYEFIIYIIFISIKNTEIIHTILLLPILFFNKTLKSIIISIRINFKQFFVTFFLIFLIIYVFSNVYFFFHNSDFNTEIDYHEDNLCRTLVFSFLNALDYGLRARGGLGDSAKRISYMKNRRHYLSRLLLDDLFFVLIIIIMIDLVFGIILNSFDELRHRNQKYKSDMINYCLICHSNKKSLENIRLDFNDHVNNIHNVWNYVEYMISLKLKDFHDLNAINQYVRAKMEKKDITWLPTYKDKFNKKDNYYDIDEKKLIVSIENVDNYKLKSNNS